MSKVASLRLFAVYDDFPGRCQLHPELDRQFLTIHGTSVLFAARGQPPHGSVRFARELADAMALPLDVVHVVEQLEGPGLAALDGLRATRALMRFIETARRSLRYYRTALGPRFADDRHSMRVGKFAEQVSVQAHELDAALVVLAAGELRGRDVTALARSLGRPVWVARGERLGAPRIVAATDLSHAAYPVLHCAKQLATVRAASVVAVHRPPSGLRRAMAAWPLALLRRKSADAAEIELARVSNALGLDRAVVLGSRDCADAILAEAQAQAAETVVIGTHIRPAFTRALSRSVAASVIDRARRSVVVQPLISERGREPH